MRYLLLFVILLNTTVACRNDEVLKPYKTGMEGKPLPDFNIQLSDSITYINSAEISKGKELLLFYYSPTCPYCRAQMRDMVNNIERFKDQQLCILTNADLKTMKRFANYFKLEKYQGLIIGRDTGRIIEKKFRIRSVPFTAYFDDKNNLKTAYSGRMIPDLLFQFH